MQSGFARTGRKFGYEHYGVKPDLICVGKGMGGGFPVSGVLGRSDVMDLPEVGNMSSTHSANPLACAAGLAVIEEIELLDLVSETERKGQILMDELCHIGEPYGKGLIASLIFKDAEFASRVAERCYQKGLLVVHTGRESIKIGPPLTIPDDALLEGVEVLCEAIAEVDSA
jgi:4-aminobutyrate aminotransferase-like enzyme